MSSLKIPGWLKTLNETILKYAGLFGIPFYIFFFLSSSRVHAANPNADLSDTAADFYGTMLNATTEHFIPGAAYVLSDIFRFTVDTILPGAGYALTEVFEATNSALSGNDQLPDFSPRY